MHEAVGLFRNMEQLQGAIRELERTEFPRDSLSVLGAHKTLDLALMPYAEDPIEEFLDAPVRSEEKVIGVGALVGGTAYAGAIAAALAAGAVTVPAIITAAAVGGAGGAAAGTVLASVLGRYFDHEVESRINEGGLLLWVRTPDSHKEELACQILTQYGADNVHIYTH